MFSIPFCKRIFGRRKKHLWTLLLALFFMFLFWKRYLDSMKTSKVEPQQTDQNAFSSRPKLCLLVPFRDRFDELTTFVPYMSNFLANQEVNFVIYVLNQVDSFRFNRAALLNSGFKYTREKENCDYYALHDVDLMPKNPNILYGYPTLVANPGPLHLCPSRLHPKYNFPDFIGGILLITKEDFEKVDGMSNIHWGWGLEDDEFRARLIEADLPVNQPQNVDTDHTNTFVHFHVPRKRIRDYRKCYNQRDITRRRDRVTGLRNVKYKVKQSFPLTVKGKLVNILDIELNCDKELTPWCDCSEAPKTESPLKPLDKKDNIMPRLPKKFTH